MPTDLIAHSYTDGRQPCADFRAVNELADRGASRNVHECFGPFDGRPRGCSGTVSFCATCRRDHHSGGWDGCGSVADVESFDEA